LTLFGKGPNPDRFAGMIRGVATRERRWMHRKWLWWVAGVILLLGAAGGYVLYLYSSTTAEIQDEGPDRDVVKPVRRPEIDPFNALLVGSDSRKGLTKAEQERLRAGTETAEGPVTGKRADSLILAHVDPQTDKVIMVQFPRDLWVPLAGGGKGKINSALERSNEHLIRTVSNLTDLEINRYAELNIAGFKDLIDAIGGVDVCIPREVPFDEHTGFQVLEPGMIHMDGDRAVRFVRSRHAFEGGDLARIQNQQKLLSAALDKITSLETLLNFGRIRELLDVAGQNLSVDRGTSPIDLLRLGQRLRSFDPRHYEAYTVPNLGPGMIDEASVILPDRVAMKALFKAIERNRSPSRHDDYPNIDPGTIRADVLNGSGRDGAASRAAKALTAATRTAEGSLIVDQVADAGRSNHKRTLVLYNRKSPETKRMARLLSAALPGSRARPGDIRFGVDVEVIVGKRFAVERIVQINPIPIPKPGKLPEVCAEDA
jgi:polyisoprenyl-teichoic acid--peptidoglycan teichoic acid transferase